MVLNQKRKFVLVTFLIVIFAGIFIFVSANAQSNTKTSPAAKLPRVVDVGADKCVPCVMMAPELEKLKKEYSGVLGEVEFVDVWKYPEEARKIRGTRHTDTDPLRWRRQGTWPTPGIYIKRRQSGELKALGILIVKKDVKGG